MIKSLEFAIDAIKQLHEKTLYLSDVPAETFSDLEDFICLQNNVIESLDFRLQEAEDLIKEYQCIEAANLLEKLGEVDEPTE